MTQRAWPTVALKRLAAIMPSNVDKHAVDGEQAVRLCNYVDVYKNERITADLDFMEATATAAQVGRFTLMAQDVVVTKDSEEPTDIGVPAYVPGNLDGVVCGYHLALLRSDARKLSGRYLHWALQTREVHAYYSTAATGISRYALSVNDLGMTPVRVPTLEQQERIANFLDEKTARIDSLIAEKKQLTGVVEALRKVAIDQTVLGPELAAGEHLRGLEAVGRIPEGWLPSRLKYELNYVTSGSRGWADYYQDEGALFVRIGNLTRESICLDLSDIQRVVLPTAAEGIRARVLPGDLLISITAYLGSVAVAPADIEEAYVSQHVALARPTGRRALPEWLAYVVLSSIGRTYFDLQGYGGTKVQLSLDDIRELPVPLPSLDTQFRRLGVLAERLGKFEELERHIGVHIERLREYRSSIISAAVTGQLRLEDFKAAT